MAVVAWVGGLGIALAMDSLWVACLLCVPWALAVVMIDEAIVEGA
jgi:hypothetical protein